MTPQTAFKLGIDTAAAINRMKDKIEAADKMYALGLELLRAKNPHKISYAKSRLRLAMEDYATAGDT